MAATLELAQGSDEFEQHLQDAVDKNRGLLEDAAASQASQIWLKPQLETTEGTSQVYRRLEKLVAGPGFLAKLTAALSKQPATPATHAHTDGEVTRPEWWIPPAEAAAGEGGKASADYEEVSNEDVLEAMEPLDSYVIVEKDDVLEAIGTFVAAYLAELPQAQKLQPKELQTALRNAFKELRKGRVRRIWEWGRCLYRCVAFSYGAFSVYENPWLVRALLAALWTASRMLFGLLI